MSKALDRIEKARAAGDHATALSLALEAWRDRRDAAITRAIEALSAEATDFVPPKTRTNKDFQKAWLEVLSSGDPIAVPWLAEFLVKRLPRDEPDPIFIARLKAMRKHPDPRFAAAIMALVVQGRDLIRWCWSDVGKTLAVVGDAVTREALESIEALRDGGKDDEDSWQRVLDALPATKPVSTADRKRWEAVAHRDDGAAVLDIEGLTTAVHEDPDDRQARAVLADALQETGDPRGEFIALQLLELDGRGTQQSTQRADELLGQHVDAWLGAIHPIVYRGWFRGGFLDKIELEPSRRASKKAWEKHARDPSLATVRELVDGKAPDPITILFLTSAAMRSLESVTIGSNAIAGALEKSLPPRLREVRCAGWSRGDYPKKFEARVLPLLEAAPMLKSLVCTDAVLELLMRSKVLERLESLTVASELDDEEVRERLLDLPKNITSLDVGWANSEAAFALWPKLPAHITRFAIKDNAVLTSSKGKTTLTLRVRSARELDRERYPYGLPELLPHAQKLDGLARLVVELFTDKVDLSALDPKHWPRGTKIETRRVYESGLTRKFANW